MKSRKYTILLCIVLSFIQCSEQQSYKSDLVKNGLKGNVKTIITKEFNADEKFGEIIKGEKSKYAADKIEIFNPNGVLIMHTEVDLFEDFNEHVLYFDFNEDINVNYDKKMDLVKIIINSPIDSLNERLWLKHSKKGLLLERYFSNRKKENWDFIKKNEYDDYGFEIKGTYINNGEEVSYSDSMIFDENGRIIEKIYNSYKFNYKYDLNGILVEQIETRYAKGDVRTKEIEKYDAQGNIIEAIDYNSDGKQKRKVVYEYNDSGDIIKAMLFGSSSLREKVTNTYNETGLLSECIHYGGFGNTKKAEKIVNRYNEKNDIVEEITYDEDGEFDDKNTFDYKYDEKGNWIQKYEKHYYSENSKGHPFSLTLRKISYYN